MGLARNTLGPRSPPRTLFEGVASDTGTARGRQVGYAARDALAGRDCAEALWGERAEARSPPQEGAIGGGSAASPPPVGRGAGRIGDFGEVLESWGAAVVREGLQ